jgi:hypothetical protein
MTLLALQQLHADAATLGEPAAAAKDQMSTA